MTIMNPGAARSSRSLQGYESGSRARVLAIALFCFAVFCTVPLNAWAKRTLVLNNVPNECGGTLYVSGSGWGPSPIRITATHAPGSKGTRQIAVGLVKKGKFSLAIGYSFDPFSGLPGCRNNANSYVSVRITAIGPHKNRVSEPVSLTNCGIVWTACPA